MADGALGIIGMRPIGTVRRTSSDQDVRDRRVASKIVLRRDLEQALDGAKVGDRFTVRIPAQEIYGEHDPALIREIPKAGLIKQRIKPGQFYRQMKKGCLVSFKVLEMRPETVLADFNRPMAGISVTLDVEILGVRRASSEEIESAREAQIKKSIGCG